MTSASELLYIPIESLPLSNDLKALLSSKGYSNLSQLLQQKISYLRIKAGLNLNHELQLYNLVKENGLVKLWREECPMAVHKLCATFAQFIMQVRAN